MTAAPYTRNFCIIAHIDHGKTTLSDRLLEWTSTIQKREAQEQHLDSMDLERERGITIKAHPVAMVYTARDGHEYKLNLLDTPGHVDFAYEVSRSLAACEGALLIVDAAQGVEAQTVANVHLAMKQGLTIVPVINKIDLPNADIPTVNRQLEDILAIPAEEAIHASAKAGLGIDEILEAVVHRIPPPKAMPQPEIVRGLVFDSVFDIYRGVTNQSRHADAHVEHGQHVRREGSGRFQTEDGVTRHARVGRRRLPHREHQDDKRSEDWRHADRHALSGQAAAARISGSASDGLFGHLSDQHGGL